jgi:hypothetical protein
LKSKLSRAEIDATATDLAEDTYDALRAQAKSKGLHLYRQRGNRGCPDRYPLDNGDREFGGELIVESTDLSIIDARIESWAPPSADTANNGDTTEPPGAVTE